MSAIMKCRTGIPSTATQQYCYSPRSAYKARKETFSYKHVYIALICGALCFSSWSLLGHQISSSLPVHAGGPYSWSSSGSSSSSSDIGGGSPTQRVSSRKSATSLLLAGALQHRLNDSLTQQSAGSAPAAVAAHTKATARRLAFQRTKTALPFIMLTCRMCDDDVSLAVQHDKVYDPVTSTLMEHALSTTSDLARVYVEIGAGTGYYSLLAAAWASDVAAFEPSADARVLLQHNAALHRDGRLKVVPYAVGAKTTLAAVLNRVADNATSNSTSSAAAANGTTGSGSAAANSNVSTSTTSTGTSSPNGSVPVKTYGVDVVRLSDALSGDVTVTILLVNAATLDGKTVPDVYDVAEGASEMLKHVKWLFMLRLPNPDSARTRTMLRQLLQNGNFSNVYSYGKPPATPEESDDAQWESTEQRDKAAAAAAAAAAAGGVHYPAETHYIDITDGIRQQLGGNWTAQHGDFLLTRHALADTLHINVPKPLIWDFGNLASSGGGSTNTTSSNSTDASSSQNATAATQASSNSSAQQVTAAPIADAAAGKA